MAAASEPSTIFDTDTLSLSAVEFWRACCRNAYRYVRYHGKEWAKVSHCDFFYLGCEAKMVVQSRTPFCAEFTVRIAGKPVSVSRFPSDGDYRIEWSLAPSPAQVMALKLAL